MPVTDKQRIDMVIRSFFSVFSNKKIKPDLDLLYQLCIPETQIIYVEKSIHTMYSLSTFIEPRKTILTDGTLTDFEEFELLEHTEITSSIAQRFSKYQKSGVRNNVPFQKSGNKYFQLIKVDGQWKISSVIWEDDN